MFIKASDTVQYEIPDDWIAFVELDKWDRRTDYYPHTGTAELIQLTDIEPLQRSLPPHGLAVRKYKLIPVLFGFQNPNLLLDPIKLSFDGSTYQLRNGIHRYIASLIVGYRSIPSILIGQQKYCD